MVRPGYRCSTRLLLFFVALGLFCGVVSGCGRGQTGEAEGAAGSVEFTILNETEPKTLDPHRAKTVTERRICTALFEGLLVRDPATAEGVPGLAISWDVSEDQTTYTFRLRKAAWSDSTPITAQTVFDSWIRLLDPHTAAPWAWYAARFIKGASEFHSGEAGPEVVEIEVVDMYTFRVEFVKPLPYAEEVLSHICFTVVPGHVIEAHGGAWSRPENLVVNGPFRLEKQGRREQSREQARGEPRQEEPLQEEDSGGKLVLVPNETYWDADTVALDRVTFLTARGLHTQGGEEVAVKGAEGPYSMYLEGEIDWIPGLGESAAWPEPGSETNPAPAEYHLTPGLATYYYVIQNQRKPFDDPRVRKALSMAIDRSALVEAVSRQGEYTTGDEVTGQGEYTTGDEAPMQGEVTAGGFVPPMAGYPGIQGNRCDGFKARRLLAEAGYPGGAGFPVFELLYNTSEYHRTVAEFVRRQWAQTLGIECELVNKEWKSYLAARRAGEFDIARAGWRGDYQDPNAFLEIFATFASLNDARYSSRDYERLMRKAATMRPGQDRMAALEKAEEILITRDQAVIPLYYYVNRNLIDTSTWGGWYENVMDSHPLKYIHKR